MGLLYRSCLQLARGVFFCTLRARVENRHLAQRDGGYVLAVTHLGHMEPFFASALSRRPIDWITRKEFFCGPPINWLLHGLNTIRVDRQGRPVSTLRTAIRRVKQGRVVGIFPEGGVCHGKDSALRGARIKKGCCSIAIRGGVPIVPCVMVGTDKLNAIKPWLPFRRAKVWIAYGEPIHPPPNAKSTRATREELATQLRAAFSQLYAHVCERYQICDSTVS
jgi:1-acyl-sn-glycerol-3-phosphate acyltransferase